MAGSAYLLDLLIAGSHDSDGLCGERCRVYRSSKQPEQQRSPRLAACGTALGSDATSMPEDAERYDLSARSQQRGLHHVMIGHRRSPEIMLHYDLQIENTPSGHGAHLRRSQRTELLQDRLEVLRQRRAELQAHARDGVHEAQRLSMQSRPRKLRQQLLYYGAPATMRRQLNACGHRVLARTCAQSHFGVHACLAGQW